MQSIEVKEGQTIFDIALQYYGAAEGVIKLIEDNPTLSLTSELESGQVLSILQEPDKYEIVSYYSKFNHTVISGTDS